MHFPAYILYKYVSKEQRLNEGSSETTEHLQKMQMQTINWKATFPFAFHFNVSGELTIKKRLNIICAEITVECVFYCGCGCLGRQHISAE